MLKKKKSFGWFQLYFCSSEICFHSSNKEREFSLYWK